MRLLGREWGGKVGDGVELGIPERTDRMDLQGRVRFRHRALGRTGAICEMRGTPLCDWCAMQASLFFALRSIPSANTTLPTVQQGTKAWRSKMIGPLGPVRHHTLPDSYSPVMSASKSFKVGVFGRSSHFFANASTAC